MNPKTVITGPGRCGTSFLMHLFTALGLNTGYTIDECRQHLAQSGCNGGIEHSIGTERFEKADIVKNPIWMYEPGALLEEEIRYIIIPIRHLELIAKSRAKMGHGKYGGFWRGATDEWDQISIDARAFYHFEMLIMDEPIELIKVKFPLIVIDSEYLYYKLYVILRQIPYLDYLKVFNEIAKPELVSV